jgi:hypothetical protein
MFKLWAVGYWDGVEEARPRYPVAYVPAIAQCPFPKQVSHFETRNLALFFHSLQLPEHTLQLPDHQFALFLHSLQLPIHPLQLPEHTLQLGNQQVALFVGKLQRFRRKFELSGRKHSPFANLPGYGFRHTNSGVNPMMRRNLKSD